MRTLLTIQILICMTSLFGVLQVFVYLKRPMVSVPSHGVQENKHKENEDDWNFFDTVCLLALENASNAGYLAYKISEAEKGNTQYQKREVSENCTEFYLHLTSCVHVTELERDFPIAFSILVYRDPEQAMRLLRAIWRPQNIYCIHVDTGSDFEVLTYILSRVKCLDNVFLAPRMIHVTWGTFSVLEADLICMAALYSHTTRWKYFINLTGQEFPLRTNHELVKILQLYAGGNDIFGQINK